MLGQLNILTLCCVAVHGAEMQPQSCSHIERWMIIFPLTSQAMIWAVGLYVTAKEQNSWGLSTLTDKTIHCVTFISRKRSRKTLQFPQ